MNSANSYSFNLRNLGLFTFDGEYFETIWPTYPRHSFYLLDDQHFLFRFEESDEFPADSFISFAVLFDDYSTLTVSKLVESPEAAAHEKTNSFLSVISSIGDWIVSSFLSLVALFWVPESGLTFFGVLAVSGLAFALIFLLIRWILSLFHR